MMHERKKFSHEEIQEAVTRVEELLEEIRGIKETPEAQVIFTQLREKKMAVGEVFRNCPPVRKIVQFNQLMDYIPEIQNFKQFGKAILRGARIGRLWEATPEETTQIVEAIRSHKRFPFLTVGYGEKWYVLARPELKSSQAMIFKLQAAHKRAKENTEGIAEKAES